MATSLRILAVGAARCARVCEEALAANGAVRVRLMEGARTFSSGGDPSAGWGSRDEIRLRDMAFFGYHGVHPEERKVGQKFLVDATLFCDLRKPSKTDDLKDTVSYSEVFGQVKRIVEGDPVNLIEHLAEKVAQDILQKHKLIQEVEIYIRKPSAIFGMHGSPIGVSIRRSSNSS